ncbi:hypothetical protein NPIL_310301 [Nephila pilipes]|uniref:Uncharacterized protein n=1 Tax=Nephila pilipes TaxID=299642 RepID=A0A8X6TUR7_NEPPI|nr:hypothetical protein NPIL_310301 [Nephila pilipes]
MNSALDFEKAGPFIRNIMDTLSFVLNGADNRGGGIRCLKTKHYKWIPSSSTCDTRGEGFARKYRIFTGNRMYSSLTCRLIFGGINREPQEGFQCCDLILKREK